jgi:hypothetical protein
MMTLLLSIFVYILIFALLAYVVQLLPIPVPFRNILLIILILMMVLYLINCLRLGHPLILR